MTIEIKTDAMEPIRHTYDHIARRFGDKPASRYQEASYDVEATINHHYKPLWAPDKLINDPSWTAVKMNDWHDLKDPRQFYYGTYVQARAKLQDVTESNYAFFDKRNLGARLPESVRDETLKCLLPLRFAEGAANMNNMYCASRAVSLIVRQAFVYAAMDRLGTAQYVSRIGLLLDGNSAETLVAAKQDWMEAPQWQPMRHHLEDVMALTDWFETFIAQGVLMDHYTYSVMFQAWDESISAQGGGDIAMLLEFMQEWFKDASRWDASALKVVIAESDQNKTLVNGWLDTWRDRARAAVKVVAETTSMDVEAAFVAADADLDKRLKKAGI